MDGPANRGKPQPGAQGENGVRLAAGKFVLQAGLPEGLLVQSAGPDDLIEPSLCSGPLSDLPPLLSFWLDREREIGLIAAAVQAPGPGRFELNGPPGAGKTALLRYLAYHPVTAAFPDGVVYLSTRFQPLPDLLQSLFDAFCRSPIPFRPEESQVRLSLAGLQALILLDDVDLTTHEIYELTGAAPGCTFFLASTERHLWHEGESVELAGLSMEAALALFEHGLGRPLAEGEHSQAYSLFAALQGQPLHVLQAAALVRQTGRSVSEISDRRLYTTAESPTSLPNWIQKQLLDALTDAERLIVFGLAALHGVSTTPDHLAALTGLPDIVPSLDRLAACGLAELFSGRCSLSAGLDELVLNTWNLTEWKFHALVYFTRWAETQPLGSESLCSEAHVLLGLMKWAEGVGHWQEALRLVRSLEGTLALSGRWEAWRQTLEMGLEAARVLGVLPAEAWALHQLGTRLLCLGQVSPARATLIQALRLRQSLGDQAGELATRRNLAVLLEQRQLEPEDRQAASRLPEFVSSIEDTSPVPVPRFSTERSFHPAAGQVPLTSTKTPARLSRRMLAGLVLFALILLVPAAVLGWGYFFPQEAAVPPTATAYTLVVEMPVVETPGAILYLPILPNQYTVPDETGAILPVTGSSPAPAYSAASAPPAGCPFPAGWVKYTIQPDDSLPFLAAAVSIPQEDLMRANCIEGFGWLTPGEEIYVPILPPSTPGAQTSAPLDGAQAAGGASSSAVPSTPASTTAPMTTAASAELPGLVISPVPGAPPAECLGFEDLALFEVFWPGDTFSTSGFNLTVNGFIQQGGRVTQGGVIEVGNGDTGRELLLDNASLSLSLTSPASGLTMLISDTSGSLNIEVNGEFRSFANLADLHQQAVGGVSAGVVEDQGDGKSTLELSGLLRSFHVGGQELWIDQICFK